jgi:hypothetical protein
MIASPILIILNYIVGAVVLFIFLQYQRHYTIGRIRYLSLITSVISIVIATVFLIL